MGPMTSASNRVAGGFVPRGRHLLAYDLVATLVAIVGAFALRFDARDPIGTVVQFAPVSLLPLVVQPMANVAFGLYRREWRYASVRELLAITSAVGVATVINAVAFVWLSSIDAPGTEGMPRSYIPLEGILCLLLVGGGRFALRIFLENGERGSAIPRVRQPASLSAPCETSPWLGLPCRRGSDPSTPAPGDSIVPATA